MRRLAARDLSRRRSTASRSFGQAAPTRAPKLGEHTADVLGAAEHRRGGAMIDDDMAFAGRDKTAVVGIGQTAFRDSGRSVLSLATEASLRPSPTPACRLGRHRRHRPLRHGHRAAQRLAAALGVNDLTYWADTGPGRRRAVHDDGPGHGRGAVRPGQDGAGVPLAERPLGDAGSAPAASASAARAGRAASAPTTSSSCPMAC